MTAKHSRQLQKDFRRMVEIAPGIAVTEEMAREMNLTRAPKKVKAEGHKNPNKRARRRARKAKRRARRHNRGK